LLYLWAKQQVISVKIPVIRDEKNFNPGLRKRGAYGKIKGTMRKMRRQNGCNLYQYVKRTFCGREGSEERE
jgi:hypothetical protein